MTISVDIYFFMCAPVCHTCVTPAASVFLRGRQACSIYGIETRKSSVRVKSRTSSGNPHTHPHTRTPAYIHTVAYVSAPFCKKLCVFFGGEGEGLPGPPLAGPSCVLNSNFWPSLASNPIHTHTHTHTRVELMRVCLCCVPCRGD